MLLKLERSQFPAVPFQRFFSDLRITSKSEFKKLWTILFLQGNLPGRRILEHNSTPEEEQNIIEQSFVGKAEKMEIIEAFGKLPSVVQFIFVIGGFATIFLIACNRTAGANLIEFLQDLS